MDKSQAIAKIDETLRLAAQSFKDQQRTKYTAEMHQTACGIALRQVFFPKQGEGLAPTNENFAAMFAATHNHSAWRQKFEKDGYFPKSKEKNFENMAADLAAELGED